MHDNHTTDVNSISSLRDQLPLLLSWVGWGKKVAIDVVTIRCRLMRWLSHIFFSRMSSQSENTIICLTLKLLIHSWANFCVLGEI